MKSLTITQSNSFSSEVNHLSYCYKLTRRDAISQYFCDHDADITLFGDIYQAKSGFSPSAISNMADFAVDELEIEGFLSSDSITDADIMAGKYDMAEISLYLVDYTNPDETAILLRKGYLGEVRLSGNNYIAAIRGLSQKLEANIGKLYSPLCRARLGDSKCGVNLASYTHTAAITTSTSRSKFTASSLTQDSGYFNYGKITFTSGLNNGFSYEIKSHLKGGIIELALPAAYDTMTGNNFTIIAGCDKLFSTCIAKFANAVNFRGEPHLPGIDKILETAATKN